MCYMGRSFAHLLPCACCLFTDLCAHRVSVDLGKKKAEKAAVLCLVD
jgi:hypothetical protein